jgi:GntR family transcriptional regulator
MQLPLHLQISEQLCQQISQGDFVPGEQLPSEHQLMSRFAVSRITVRRAISNLVQQGLVTPKRGKGVFVKAQQKVTYSLSSPVVFFEQDMARQGVTSGMMNLVFEPMTAPDAVQEILQLPAENPEVYLQKKLLLIDQVPVAIDISYILPELGKALASQLQRQMTFSTLEQNGVEIEQIAVRIECTHANHEMSEYLGVPLGGPLLVYSHTAYNPQNQPILFGKAFSRGDRLSYSAVLSKSPLTCALDAQRPASAAPSG